MKKFMTIALTAALAATVTACATTREDVKEANEEAKATQEEFVKDEALYTAGVLEHRMGELDGKIEDVKEMCKGEDGAVKAELIDVVQAMDTRKAALDTRASYLREHADEMAEAQLQDEWRAVTEEIDEIDASLNKIQSSVNS